MKKSAEFLSSAAVVGLMAESSENGLNLVNALTLAKETGITVSTYCPHVLPDCLIEMQVHKISGSGFKLFIVHKMQCLSLKVCLIENLICVSNFTKCNHSDKFISLILL